MSLSNKSALAPNSFVYTLKNEERIIEAIKDAYPVFRDEGYVLRPNVLHSIMLSPVDGFTEEFRYTKKASDEALLNLSVIFNDEDRSQIEKLTGLTSRLMNFEKFDADDMHSMFGDHKFSTIIFREIMNNIHLRLSIKGWVEDKEEMLSTPASKKLYESRDRVAMDSLWLNLKAVTEKRGERLSMDEMDGYFTLDGFARAAVMFKSEPMIRLVKSIGGGVPTNASEVVTQPQRATTRFERVITPISRLLSIQYYLFHAFCRVAQGVHVNNALMKASAQRLKRSLEQRKEGLHISYTKCLQAISVGLFGCPFEEAKVVHLPSFTAYQVKCILEVVLDRGESLSCYHDLLGLGVVEVSDEMAERARLDDRLIMYAAIYLNHEDEWSAMPMGRSYSLSLALCQCLAYRQAEQNFVLSFKNVLKAHTVDEVIRLAEDESIPLEGNALLKSFMDTLPLQWREDGTIDKDKSSVGLELLSLLLMTGSKYLRYLSALKHDDGYK